MADPPEIRSGGSFFFFSLAVFNDAQPNPEAQVF